VHLRRVLDDIAREGISEVIFGGDIGNDESVEGFFEILSEYALTSSIVLGNRDSLRDFSRYWNDGFDTN
jgi:3',5'-cyclic-AMP phosphodiesterase